jgi:hypothetical protein
LELVDRVWVSAVGDIAVPLQGIVPYGAGGRPPILRPANIERQFLLWLGQASNVLLARGRIAACDSFTRVRFSM